MARKASQLSFGADLRGPIIIESTSAFGAGPAAGATAATGFGSGRSDTVVPPSVPYTNGLLFLPVPLMTSSRTRPNAMRKSRPGTVRFFNRAVVNGLCMPSPSAAVDPALAANAISVSVDGGSILARPRPMERVSLVRCTVRTNGLSRHASRIIRRSRLGLEEW